MRINFTCILLLIAFMQVAFAVRAQKISISKKNATLTELFRDLRKQTGYDFVLPKDLLKQAKPVTVQVKNADLEQVLRICFDAQPFTYEVNNKIIIVSEKEKSIIDKLAARLQTIDVKGNVTGENGIPLPGATVTVKGSNRSFGTDASGYFEIKNIDENAILQISFIGYATKEVQLSAETTRLIIKLILAENKLDEVVLVGYGTSTKRLKTGTVNSVSAKDITSQPLANPLVALAGRISGMVVSQDNGLPGSSVSVQIRGNNSLQSGRSPLYVIDGVPFSNENLNAYGVAAANGGISPFSAINPADIERVDVLKDADATAIYGARGANGVVLITTKRGQTGMGKLSANFYKGVGKVGHFIPMLNTQQYLELRREAFANDGITPDEFNAPDLTTYDQRAYTNWQKELIGGTANLTDAQTSFSGGTDNLRFLVNANYRKEGTVYKQDMGNERIGTRMNLDYGAQNSRFTAQFSAAFSSDKTNLIPVDLTSAYALPPNYPLYNPDGSLYWDFFLNNPLAYTKQKYNGITQTILGNATFKYIAANHLNLKLNLGFNQSTLDQKSAYPQSSNNPNFGMPSIAFFANSRSRNYIAEPTADYTIKADQWKLNFLAGGSLQSSYNTAATIIGSNYSNEQLMSSISAAGLLTPSYQNDDLYHFNSLFGRINFNFSDRYIVNLNWRRDGSSKFGLNNRFGKFASVGGAWLFTEESFAKNAIPFLDFGKLRASYGTTGNDQIQNYLYLPIYRTGSIYDQQSALSVSRVYNPNIKWESTRKLEIAIDLGLFKDSKLLITANYYRNRSSNHIMNNPIASQTGFGFYMENVNAVIQNTGLEFDLTSKNVSGAHFAWNTSFNITFAKNKLLSFPGLENSLYKNLYMIGQPANLQRYFQTKGIDAATGLVNYQITDGASMPDYLPAPVGHPFFGGISNNFNYRGWSLDFLVQFTKRYGLVNNISQSNYSSVLGGIANQNTSTLNRWRKAGDENTLFPGASANPGSLLYANYNYFDRSTNLFGDNSFIRFKSVNVGYSFHSRWIKRLKLSALNIYLQGQNLLTLTKNKYVFDPESSGNGVGTMPALRTFVLGMNCSF
ncbi:SusC/RagA family TonB-linked outer membrane protein [Pedobacter sp. MC2016-24]|uniref:SusC/RagA family TonB-linked outer membrane protein n=1 Tax=Pedobacter sp. MC2016-24 TaxID=2780090 RepID=UPI0018822E67|nr:SusC/RagA family TonB-linked outer membrane protein [Pedobacter sp. MC2016-24]MBE9599858.1 SusC/RagA family TonB-linked outer membrane protein [Pedobacter sp. MC2016-24]